VRLHKIRVFLSVCFAVRFKRIGRHTGKFFTPWTRGKISRRANKGCSLFGMRQLHYRWEMRRVHPRSLPWHRGSSCCLPSVCVFFMPYINTLVNFPYCVAFCTYVTFTSTFFVQWNWGSLLNRKYLFGGTFNINLSNHIMLSKITLYFHVFSCHTAHYTEFGLTHRIVITLHSVGTGFEY